MKSSYNIYSNGDFDVIVKVVSNILYATSAIINGFIFLIDKGWI